jgi:hypothetical protein
MAPSTWKRKPRVSKQQLADGMDRAAAQQSVILTALGMISRWSGMWKRAAKHYRAESEAQARWLRANAEDILNLRIENEALLRRVSDLEGELNAHYRNAGETEDDA